MQTTISMFPHWQSFPSELAGPGSRWILPLMIGSVLALPWTVCAAESATAQTAVAPSARMLAKAQDFRQQAQTESEAAFVRYVGNTDKAKKLFGFLGKTLCPHTEPAKGWVYFFETSIWSLGFPTSTSAVAVFYHPWSDVALVTEWTRNEADTTLTDADLIMGDALRNLSKPPYEIAPHWLRSSMPPYLAAGISSARTVRGFEKTFSPSNKSLKAGWRSALQLGNASLMETNHAGVGTMFESNLAGLTRYLEEAAMAPVRNQTRNVLEQIRAGNLEQVYKLAPATKPQVRAILKKYADKWADAKVITCVTKRDDQKKEHLLVLLSMPRLPELFMNFWFQPGASASLPPTMTRIDMVDQNQSYKYLGSIDMMNEAPERGDLTRATIESGDWFGRLITIGEAAMQRVALSASSGPVGNLLGGCCDELIGSTSWDLVGAPSNGSARPAREQLPNKSALGTGAVRGGTASPPPQASQRIPQNGRPQGDGVIPSSVGLTPPSVSVSGLPPKPPPGTPQGEHLPSGNVVPPNTGGPPPHGPQVTHPDGRPPGVAVPPPNSGPPPNHSHHETPPPVWYPPAGSGPPTGSGGGGSGLPPGGGSCPGGG